MSKQYQVILRAYNNKNQKFDLEIDQNIELKLDISAIESQEIGELFGISSQTFTIPGNDNSNQFFNNVFDLGATQVVAFGKTVACQVLVDGQSVFAGKLYISNVTSDTTKNIIYNCVVTNETIDFRTLVDNRTLASLSGSWQKYNHTYNWTNISQSWNNNLFSGSVFYPLANYGSQVNDPTAPTIGFSPNGGFLIGTGSMDNPGSPLKVSQFKPAIQVKTILDEIFASINYKYTSSFINTDYFKSIYYLDTPDEKPGVSFVNMVSQSLVATPTVSQSMSNLAFTKINYGTEITDTGLNWNPTTSTYTTIYSGSYTFSSNLTFQITASGAIGAPSRAFVFALNVNGLPVTNTVVNLGNNTSGIVSMPPTLVSVNAGDIITVTGKNINSRATEVFKITPGINSSWLKVVGAPTAVGGTINIGAAFDPSLMVKDFIKGLSEKFNLVIEPVRNEKNILSIEPFNTWIDNGAIVDWTQIVDGNVKYKVTSPLINQARNLYFSDALDSDVLNTNYNTTFKKIYGEYKFTTALDLAQGDKRIGEKFAATPTRFINNSSLVEVPWLCKEDNTKALVPFDFKGRLLHKTPVVNVPANEAKGNNGVTTGYYYINDGGTVRAINFYSTALPTYYANAVNSLGVGLVLPAPSSSLHFDSSTYKQYKTFPFPQYIPGAYDNYWSFYVNEIYDVDARLLTCNVVLKPSEIPNIQLNDRIFIDGQYYRINKINGANLVTTDSVEVELLKTAPRKIPYNGRRRIITPRSNEPNAFVDVIIDTYNDDGSITYVDFETNTVISDPDIITQVVGIDGNDYYTGTTWDNEQYQVYNPNIISLGPNKYNETLTNVVNVGSGNSITDYTSNSMILGNNNVINAFNATQTGSSAYTAGITIIADNTTINESTNVVVIQPSGSRIISGSSNNVFVNPINDINPSDPTGSVYTGNLINQGTADFKGGASMTGSVDITGSLTLNGQPITPGSGGGTGSAVNFNFAFGTDPTTTTFVTIPSAIGSNRTFALEYVLTSGSLAINAGQLQVSADGTAAVVEAIIQRNLAGAPTASFIATYTGSALDVRTTFVGSNYIISGSYVPIKNLYAGGSSGTTINTGSLATTGSNTFIGNQTITGSLSITGSATLNDVPLQFLGPLNSAYRPIDYTFVPATSSINTLHISQSGIYNIDTTSYPSGISSSVNIYYYLDLLPTSSEVQLAFTQPSGSGVAVKIATLVTCSNSTYYWSDATNVIGSTTNNYFRQSKISRQWYGNVGIPTSVVKTQTGELFFQYTTYYSSRYLQFQLSGSSGTPIT